ncbi:glycoside hydrolase N-terminal domain-containing protein [uncultured Amnibacterium sp.]|uniref:glycosyl hydrolase family 95 catalytic domain-containing protein n=1 Tax=uncultured Amnibacterium sp. TaxID=1631851 RepID=UPI0035CC2E70
MDAPRAPQLRYTAPATSWTEALPLGNGRLGVMVFGGVDREHLQINDGTAWSGSPASERLEPRVDRRAAADAIAAARAAIRAGRHEEAVEPLQRLQHRHSQSYEPFAELTMLIGDGSTGTDYRRALELDSALHRVTYGQSGHTIERELFVSRPDGVAVMTVRVSDPAGTRIELIPSSPLEVVRTDVDEHGSLTQVRLPSAVSPPVDGFDDPVEFDLAPHRSMTGVLAVGWSHDGTAEGPLAARGVRSARIVFTTDTTFTAIGQAPDTPVEVVRARARARVATALAADGEALRRRQAEDHGGLFARASLDTGGGTDPDSPTDERLRTASADADGAVASDPGLVGLLYDYGRYLLISSSRPGGVPANLQGIWNDRLQPMWSSNYTTNINLEMNYWPAEVAGLAECAEPLHDLIDALAVNGRETAKRIYGAPGWVVHHNTDVWAYTQPVGWGRHDPRWAFWPLGAAWLCHHLIEHVRFGADEAFARDRAWGPTRSAAEFLLAWLAEEPDGRLSTIPSTSPENRFLDAAGAAVPAGISSTMDLALITDLLASLVELARLTGRDEDPVARAAAAALPRIAPPTVARDGRVAEWPADAQEVEPDHRHVSHLWSAFPGSDALDGPFGAAVSASLDGRGDASTGWSLVWKLALRARLRQPGKVDDLLRLVFADMSVDRGEFGGGIYPNLFSAHPPFQIDGNLGFVAAITESIVQSHRGSIELLPAVPTSLPRGRLRGAIARPGIAVDVDWAPGPTGAAVPLRVELRAIDERFHGRHRVVWNDTVTSVDLGSAPVVLSATHWGA